jgi:dipeptide/tripeptide permease
MIKFSIIFLALLFSFLFFNMKITRIALLLAFKQEEEKKETMSILLVMVLAVLFWTIYLII